jgi:hypothetical protein
MKHLRANIFAFVGDDEIKFNKYISPEFKRFFLNRGGGGGLSVVGCGAGF